MARGHVYRRRQEDGRWSRWRAVIDLPKRGDTKRRQVTRSFDTASEAHAWLAQMVTARGSAGNAGDAAGPLMAEYLADWLDGQVYLRPSSRATYRLHLDRHVIPAFADRTVSQVTVPSVEQFARDLAAKGLVAGTVQRILATLRSAMSHAVRIGLVGFNPASGIRVPASVSRPAQMWTPQESACFLAALDEGRTGVMLRLALVTGMRRGELLGLRWSHVHLEGAFLRVQASRVAVGGLVVEGHPKSRSGLRTVYLDPQTVTLLRRLQGAHKPAEEPVRDELLFTDTDGRPLAPWWVSRHFEKVVTELGLPRIRFHDLRHSSATLGLASGESLKEVSARLGHSGIAITADIYTEVLPESARQSTDRRVALMTGAMSVSPGAVA